MALILGLWSVVLEPGKTYSQTTTPAIQITNISFGAEVKGDARSVVSIKYPEFEQDSDDEDDEDDSDDEEGDDSEIKLPKIITKEAVLAVLKPNATEQVSVNINLVEDVEVVEFSVTGPNAVHLVGHYVRQEDFDQDPYSDSEGSEGEYGSEFDEDDSELEGLSGMIGEGSEDESMDEGRFEELKDELKKNANSKKRAAAEVEPEAPSSAAAGADESMSSTLSKNQKKKLAKKLKGADGAAAPAPVAAAAAPVAEKKAEAPKPKEAAPKKEAPKTQTLAGGLIITDAKKGDGPVAKAGKKVGMRYIGKLENGKIFDSNTKGAPLVFTLGRGEVIKGWDLGVSGMAVGGERKLTIPAALAYGKKGAGRDIPPNSTLIFDVKLVSLK